jgi:inner membrane protein
MDSLTHIVLGAAIGDRILGRKIGRKAAWIGALAKTFPDFDLFTSGLNDPRKYILYHRSYTHSFFVELLTAFPMAALCWLLFRKAIPYKQWFWLWLACLWGHSLVDWCTNYGTRLFLPFSEQLFALNNIAIADVFLTLPILLLVTAGLIARNQSRLRHRLMNISLLYTVLYFSMTFVNKAIADRHFRASAQKAGIRAQGYMSNPTILNNILWYSLIREDSTLWIGEYSLLQHSDSVAWTPFAMNPSMLSTHPSEDARMLQWFSQGFPVCVRSGDTLDVFIPKFGRGDLDQADLKKTFIFYYRIYPDSSGNWGFSQRQPGREEMRFGDAFRQLLRHVQAEGK